jgi:FMN phosphatase YigB (HAD superfamily)
MLLHGELREEMFFLRELLGDYVHRVRTKMATYRADYKDRRRASPLRLSPKRVTPKKVLVDFNPAFMDDPFSANQMAFEDSQDRADGLGLIYPESRGVHGNMLDISRPTSPAGTTVFSDYLTEPPTENTETPSETSMSPNWPTRSFGSLDSMRDPPSLSTTSLGLWGFHQQSSTQAMRDSMDDRDYDIVLKLRNKRAKIRPCLGQRQHSSAYSVQPLSARAKMYDMINAAEWIAIDLDHVLHDYVHAATLSAAIVLAYLEATYNIEIPVTSTRILVGSGDAYSTFPDGKLHYHGDSLDVRLSKVLKRISLRPSLPLLMQIKGIFNDAMRENRVPRNRAAWALYRLRMKNKKIAIIADGNEFAQREALEQLGLDKYINYLGSSSMFAYKWRGVTDHTDRNLLYDVLRDLRLDPCQMLYIGWSKDRQIEPARSLGIPVIHFADEKRRYAFERPTMRVHSFAELEEMMDGTTGTAARR